MLIPYRFGWRTAVALGALVLLVLSGDGAGATGDGNSITTPDSAGEEGAYTSLVLDANGYPVAAYLEGFFGNLKVLHCNDPNCAGSDDSITTPDPDLLGSVGGFTSIVLDASGNPVVSYFDFGNSDLKILHCNDPNCAGGDESITSPDTGGNVGTYTSLALDSNGRPVVSYQDESLEDLKVLHCNDVNCAGGDESITSPDTFARTGFSTSLALDSSGNPVISYFNLSFLDLRLMHCNDVNCAGGNENIASADMAGAVGYPTSLKLDALGDPVIAYGTSDPLQTKLLHCNDPNCASGDDTASIAAENAGSSDSLSLALDGAGYPVISYRGGNNRLQVLHCNDPNCVGGGEANVSPDTDIGAPFSSLQVDGAGRPVVAYFGGDSDLRLLHCGNTDCRYDSDGDGCPDADEKQTAVGSETSGGRRDSKNPWDYFNPTHDGMIRADDILVVVLHYGLDQGEPGYSTDYDRTFIGPNPWNLGPPDGMIRAADILAVVKQYAHDCS